MIGAVGRRDAPARPGVATSGVAFSCTHSAVGRPEARDHGMVLGFDAGAGAIVESDTHNAEAVQLVVDKFVADHAAVEAPLLGMLLANALDALAERRRDSATRRVREWICSPDGRPTFSFERACESLALEPTILRRRVGLRRQVARRVSRRGFRRGPSA